MCFISKTCSPGKLPLLGSASFSCLSRPLATQDKKDSNMNHLKCHFNTRRDRKVAKLNQTLSLKFILVVFGRARDKMWDIWEWNAVLTVGFLKTNVENG